MSRIYYRENYPYVLCRIFGRIVVGSTNRSDLELLKICNKKVILLHRPFQQCVFQYFFTRESSYCFQCVLAIAILYVRLSVTRVDQSKTVQDRITKSSPSAAWKTLVSETVKFFRKFERGHPERGR